MTDLCMLHCSTNTNHLILPHSNFRTQVTLTWGLYKMDCLHWALEFWAHKCGVKPGKLSKKYEEPKICIHYCCYTAYCFEGCGRWEKKALLKYYRSALSPGILYNLHIVCLHMITHTILSFIYQNRTSH